MSLYIYSTARGIAVLNKGDDASLKTIGKYKTEAIALDACIKHYEKACHALTNLGKQKPDVLYL